MLMFDAEGLMRTSPGTLVCVPGVCARGAGGGTCRRARGLCCAMTY